MSVNLIDKARASRIAATQYVAERKSNLIGFHEYQRMPRKKSAPPVFGFVSSRKEERARIVAA